MQFFEITAVLVNTVQDRHIYRFCAGDYGAEPVTTIFLPVNMLQDSNYCFCASGGAER